MENCNEIFLNEVTHVEIVRAADCSLPIPFNIGELTEMNGCEIGAAVMTIDVTDGTGDGTILSAPVLKTTEKPQAAGYLRQHDLQIPVGYGYEEIRRKKGLLAGIDFHAILRTQAGTEFLLYALPNTSAVSVEDQLGTEQKQTVKVSMMSMSNMVRIARRHE